MKLQKLPSAMVLSIALFGPAMATADDNGIDKEDLKRLQINAFAEELQAEMEQSAKTELKSKMVSTQVDIQNNLAASTMEENTIVSEPTVGSR